MHPHSHDKVRVVIQQLKTHKPVGHDGLIAGLFKKLQSLLNIAQKVFRSVPYDRLKRITKTLIGLYYYGFRNEKSTIDQIFTLWQILKKSHENWADI